MWYEINVSLNGKHLFATDKRSVTTEDKLREVLDILEPSLAGHPGINVSVTQWETTGKSVTTNAFA